MIREFWRMIPDVIRNMIRGFERLILLTNFTGDMIPNLIRNMIRLSAAHDPNHDPTPHSFCFNKPG